MKPFNLELAKAGAAICTRDGRNVTTDFTIMGRRIYAQIEGDPYGDLCYLLNGQIFDDRECEYDLMLKDEKENDTFFKNVQILLSDKIKAYNNRPKPPAGKRYRRTSYDTLIDKGVFSPNTLISEYILISEKKVSCLIIFGWILHY